MIEPINPFVFLAIDIGNTRTKMAYFGTSEYILKAKPPQKIWVFPTAELDTTLAKSLAEFPKDALLKIGFISTAPEKKYEEMEIWKYFSTTPIFHNISSQSEFPLTNCYATPQTLGTDRIVAVVGAMLTPNHSPILVVDAGTAITYDFANIQREYLGGGISPGIRMRFMALHQFTARLPLIETFEHTLLIGNSTSESIISGVINGTIAEIEGIINRYIREHGQNISVFLTGGDAAFLSKKIHTPHILDENLVLKGIAALSI